jgi:lipopolysaccharide heptosyltransferase I
MEAHTDTPTHRHTDTIRGVPDARADTPTLPRPDTIRFTTAPTRILIIKPSALGDVVHTLPVLNLLRRRWPDAHVAWVVGGAFASLLEGHPQLDVVIRFERRRFARGWRDPGAAAGLLRFARDLRRGEFDLVIDLQGLLRSGWMTMRTRAPVRVGFSNARELAHLFYTHRVPVDSSEQHAVDRYLKLCEALGCGRTPVEFAFHLTDDDRRHVAAALGHDRPFAVLLPGTNWPTKRWPVEHFAALVGPLRERFGLDSIVAGGADVAGIAGLIPRATNLVGKTTNLRQLVALLDRADLVIANDSGPMHIAAALGRPLVTVFGPTNPRRTGPYGRLDSVVRLDIPCSPCYSRRCSHQSCLRWLQTEHVLEIAERQLRLVPSPSGRGLR